MPVSAGIKVQQSRFAVLKVESADSDSEEEWHKVGGGKAKKQPVQGARGAADGSKPMSKNAKKRARKKRNQQSASSEPELAGGGVQPGPHGAEGRQDVTEGRQDGAEGRQAEGKADGSEWKQWLQTDEDVIDEEFQKNMEEAILLSTLEAQQRAEIDKQRRAAKEISHKASHKPAKNKKGITLTLQELHTGAGMSLAHSQERKSPEEPSLDLDSDLQFFHKVTASAQSEVKREQGRKQTSTSLSSPLPSSPGSPSVFVESPRVAQLMDEVEKRDTAIAALRKENEALKRSLKEVKERNLSLCKILSQGEFSSKAKLLQQLEELSSVKDELTTEIESLHSHLEQERSKNKALSVELSKLQGNGGKGTKASRH